MQTVVLGNGRLADQVCAFLREREELLGVVVHPAERRRDLPERPPPRAWVWPAGRDEVAALEPDCLLSVLFGYRIPEEWLAIPAWRALNLHPGYLPYNAGANPNVWPLVDGSPAGTTLHIMTESIDAGEIITQRKVATRPEDTAGSLYQRLMDASFEMFVEVWPDVRTRRPVPQPPGGTFHSVAELDSLDPSPSEQGLIDRLRARTFPPFGAEFERQGRRYRIRVDIEPLD
jgi:methionyl-tRNA formyltransferase